jgi:plastocyanin
MWRTFARLLTITALLASFGCDTRVADQESTDSAPGSVSGTIVNENGVGVAGAPIVLTKGSESRSGVSGSVGRFSFFELEPGAWTVEVAPPAGHDLAVDEQASRTVVVPPGAPVALTVKVRRTTGVIAGVVHIGGLAVPGAEIFVSGVLGSRISDNLGRYSFAHVPAGTRTVTVVLPAGYEHEGARTAQVKTNVVAGDTTSLDWFVAVAPAAIILLTNNTFVPSVVTVPIKSTVRWTNVDNAPHDITFDSVVPAPPGFMYGIGYYPAIPAFTSGSRALLALTTGTFTYHCTLHPGMTGTVIVQ